MWLSWWIRLLLESLAGDCIPCYLEDSYKCNTIDQFSAESCLKKNREYLLQISRFADTLSDIFYWCLGWRWGCIECTSHWVDLIEKISVFTKLVQFFQICVSLPWCAFVRDSWCNKGQLIDQWNGTLQSQHHTKRCDHNITPNSAL